MPRPAFAASDKTSIFFQGFLIPLGHPDYPTHREVDRDSQDDPQTEESPQGPRFTCPATSVVCPFRTRLTSPIESQQQGSSEFFHKLIYGAPSQEINNSQTSLLLKGIQRSQPTRPDTRQPITLDILNKCLQVGSIKGYLSGIQFFHKLIYGAPSQEINNSQTSLLLKGIQRSQPTRPDTRQPITLDILNKCIRTLRTGYQPLNTARTLNAMFILAFFGFLRCSELAITSKFNPRNNPTISDLSVLDGETISFLIKQSKTDQTKKGNFIYIFNLPSPIHPYQSVRAYLQWRSSQAKSPAEPLFIDESNKPVTRFWFQKHLKSVLQQSGFPTERFSSHSFRIGAATTAAQKGLSQHQIQALGRWSSDACQSYIRTNRFHIKKAHQSLID
ncbi:uncharacterized protein [Misgurnus anguillicaudatus]|uniref:uncharacterized protein n=1 Tax=Misgurnus anguillicaudatus TaxID=75329 RepID=UPI003CCEF9FB